MRTTHTFATLEVSQSTYDEVAKTLKDADYDHVFVEQSDGVLIDMHGIALKSEEPTKTKPK